MLTWFLILKLWVGLVGLAAVSLPVWAVARRSRGAAAKVLAVEAALLLVLGLTGHLDGLLNELGLKAAYGVLLLIATAAWWVPVLGAVTLVVLAVALRRRRATAA